MTEKTDKIASQLQNLDKKDESSVSKDDNKELKDLNERLNSLEKDIKNLRENHASASSKTKQFFVDLHEKRHPNAFIAKAQISNNNLATRARQYLGPNTQAFLVNWERLDLNTEKRPLSTPAGKLAQNLLCMTNTQSGPSIRHRVETLSSYFLAPVTEILKMVMYPSQLSATALIKELSILVFSGEMIWAAGDVSTTESCFIPNAKSLLAQLSQGKNFDLGVILSKISEILPTHLNINFGHPRGSGKNADWWFANCKLPLEQQTENLLSYEDRCVVSAIPRKGSTFNFSQESESSTRNAVYSQGSEQPHTSTSAVEQVRKNLDSSETSFLKATRNVPGHNIYEPDSDEEDEFDIYDY